MTKPKLFFSGLVYLLILLYILFFSWLSIARHETFQSNAMDLGYSTQVVWNTLHGRFMQFSTLQDAPIDLPLTQFRRTDILLAYHTEFLLVPISLLYLLYDSPITLLVFQTIVIALGALPAFWLARDHLGSPFAGLVFATAYLLAPAIGGANLSDFHAVSLTASILLFAFYCLHARRSGIFVALMVLAMLAKEDIPLLLVTIGFYVYFVRRERRVGALTILLGLGWFLICTQVILPAYNGLPNSPFFQRITVFGPTIKASLLNILRDPGILLRWLTQPEIVTYLGGLLASAGFTSLFCPPILVLSAPVIAMNVFSSWSWTYSEGAHYSASAIPLIVVSGIYGMGFLARQLSRRFRLPAGRVVNALALLVLSISAIHHVQIGISPLSRSFYPPRFTAHHRLARELMALIPPDAPLSMQSGLYPHLAHREKAYLFPAILDAEYVFLDVTGPSYPITTAEVYATALRLLSQDFGVLAARDGYLLMQRGLVQDGGTPLPDEFYTFARTTVESVPHPLPARWGESIELVGYDYTLFSTVHAHQLPATVATYWRPLRPQPAGQTFAFFFSRLDGAIVYLYDGETPTTTWYPVEIWQEGEVIRVETPILGVGRLHEALAAIVQPAGDSWSIESRVQPIESASDPPQPVYDEGTLLKLLAFP